MKILINQSKSAYMNNLETIRNLRLSYRSSLSINPIRINSLTIAGLQSYHKILLEIKI